MDECEKCGKVDETVRLCCVQEGRSRLCKSCIVKPGKPGHICGVGMLNRSEEP